MAKDIKYIFNSYIQILPSMVSVFKTLCNVESVLDYKKYLNVYFIVQRMNSKEIKSLDKFSPFNEYRFFYSDGTPVQYVGEPYEGEELLSVRTKEKLEFQNIKNKIKHIDFKLLNLNEKTFNKDSFEEHEYSYQRLRDINVKHILFSKYSSDAKLTNNCLAKKSCDFMAAKNSYQNNQKTNSKYLSFVNDYRIAEKRKSDGTYEPEVYKSNDYFRLGIDENKIIENEIVLVCDDLQYFENTKDQNDEEKNDQILNTGVYGFLLTYKAKISDNQLDNFKVSFGTEFEVPIMLYQYAKPTYSNYNKIKLVFNVNGLFGVV